MRKSGFERKKETSREKSDRQANHNESERERASNSWNFINLRMKRKGKFSK